MGQIRIGISGWRYAPWRGVFYPDDLAQRRELEYAAARFATIELNGSFYSLQHPSSYARWRAQTPDGFVFAIKGSRYITHLLRLKNIDQALANFYASGLFALGDKLGPFLWQFPEMVRFDEQRFDEFFARLPRDTRAAAALARRRDARLHGRAKLKPESLHPLRHAVEIRHPSFVTPAFLQLCRRHGVALVFADTAGRWPYVEELTSDFVYIRLHGDVELYTSGYTDAALADWAARIRRWGRTRDVYCYFDNDVKVRAPYDARTLARMLGLDAELPPLEPFRLPRGGWSAGLGPRARKYAPVFRRAPRRSGART
jgi:uncharacterized protein YecE (DUF72 family)